MERIAHTVANDIVKQFTGKDGLFLSSIVFVSDRDGSKEIYAMDFDGRSVRRLTSVRSLALSPAGGRSGKIAYTSYAKLYPQIWMMNADGGGKREVPTGVELNASPRSPRTRRRSRSPAPRGETPTSTWSTREGAGSGGSRPRGPSRRRPPGRPRADRSSTPRISPATRRSTRSIRRERARAGSPSPGTGTTGVRVARRRPIAVPCRNEGDFNICLMDFAKADRPADRGGIQRSPHLVAGRREDRLLVAPAAGRTLHDGPERTEQETAHRLG